MVDGVGLEKPMGSSLMISGTAEGIVWEKR